MTTSTSKRPTIRDVAREAGVSYATVSRVLNGGRWVAPDSQRAVERAIEKTGYRTNQAARSLATGRTSSYVFLLTAEQRALFDDPNFGILFRSAAEALDRRKLALVLMVASTPGERRRAKAYILGGHVDGVLLVSPHEGDTLVTELLEAQIPIVSNGAPTWDDRLSTVTADDAGGGRRAVEHLVAGGRRLVTTIVGPSDSYGGQQRFASYRAVLAEAGLPAASSQVVTGDWGRDTGEAGMARLLEQHPDLDAVFASNDAMAVGAYAALRAAGRRVPDDVAVVGFDDTVLAGSLDPALTTVRVPLEQISREMVRIVAGEEHNGTTHVTIPTQLVVRASAP